LTLNESYLQPYMDALPRVKSDLEECCAGGGRSGAAQLAEEASDLAARKLRSLRRQSIWRRAEKGSGSRDGVQGRGSRLMLELQRAIRVSRRERKEEVREGFSGQRSSPNHFSNQHWGQLALLLFLIFAVTTMTRDHLKRARTRTRFAR